jgi:hypothetical protein
MLSWESSKIGDTQLLKSTIKLAKKAVQKANIALSDIGLIVHGGVFRENFRTEPAFSTHIQGELNVHCTGISFESESCFSFDVTDGSCSPHIALQSIADILPSMKNKYALLCIGDDRPSKHCEWNQESYCIVAVIGLSGNGPKLTSVDFDNSSLDVNVRSSGYFDDGIRRNRIETTGEIKSVKEMYIDDYYSGDNQWLSGQHMHEFLIRMNGHNDTLEHCIVDRSGKSTTAKWVF